MKGKRKTAREGCDYAIWIKQCLCYLKTDTMNERTAGGSEKGGESRLQLPSKQRFLHIYEVCPL